MKKLLLTLFIALQTFLIADQKITCDLRGGLGNQLFQIVTTSAHAWDHGYTPVFERISHSPTRVGKRPVYWDTVFHNCQTFKPGSLPLHWTDFHAADGYVPITCTANNIKLWGHFESPRYFNHHRDRVLHMLTPPSKIEKLITKKYKKIAPKGQETVSIHIRRDDQVSSKPLKWLIDLWEPTDRDYYDRALSYFPNATIVIFCDQPKWAKKFIGKRLTGRKVHYVHEEDYIEMYLMARCTHNIIANSTFSWWGAYLNKNPNKKVITPKYFLYDPKPFGQEEGFFYRHELIMSDWIVIENNRVLPEHRKSWS
ncbi:MAG: alpha-1,2-fucosyltransferase [Chlamydiales bacterium]|nr:alpha-1,2-fucosyltransferase [Chlamydiales bacterium]